MDLITQDEQCFSYTSEAITFQVKGQTGLVFPHTLLRISELSGAKQEPSGLFFNITTNIRSNMKDQIWQEIHLPYATLYYILF